MAPRPSHIAAFPGRFEMHVLSFESAYDYLEKAILILKRHAPDIRVLLTVSPIPLMMTHRDMDVMVANTYSKSLLRTVAETIVTKHDFVTYYPSYEAIVLSDRKITWMEDLVHVTNEMIAINVGRMIEAYVELGEDENEIVDAVTAHARAMQIRERGPEMSAAFFDRHGAWSAKSVDFALEHARFLLDSDRSEDALQVVSQHPADTVVTAVVRAKALIAVGRAEEAYELLNTFCTPKSRSPDLWDTFMTAAMATGNPDVVNATFNRFSATVGFRAGIARVEVAKWFLARGDKERSLVLASGAIDAPMAPGLKLDLVDLFVELGDMRRAGATLDRIEAPPKFLLPRIERVRSLLVASDPV